MTEYQDISYPVKNTIASEDQVRILEQKAEINKLKSENEALKAKIEKLNDELLENLDLEALGQRAWNELALKLGVEELKHKLEEYERMKTCWIEIKDGCELPEPVKWFTNFGPNLWLTIEINNEHFTYKGYYVIDEGEAFFIANYSVSLDYKVIAWKYAEKTPEPFEPKP